MSCPSAALALHPKSGSVNPTPAPSPSWAPLLLLAFPGAHPHGCGDGGTRLCARQALRLLSTGLFKATVGLQQQPPSCQPPPRTSIPSLAPLGCGKSQAPSRGLRFPPGAGEILQAFPVPLQLDGSVRCFQPAGRHEWEDDGSPPVVLTPAPWVLQLLLLRERGGCRRSPAFG